MKWSKRIYGKQWQTVLSFETTQRLCALSFLLWGSTEIWLGQLNTPTNYTQSSFGVLLMIFGQIIEIADNARQ